MRRRWIRLLLALVLALVPAGVGTVAALLATRPGQELLGRLAGEELSRQFRGEFRLQRVSGSLVRSLALNGLSIRDTAGQPFAEVEQLRVRYALPSLLAGHFVFTHAELTRPEVRIVKRANGRLNLHEIFRLGEGPGGGPSPLVEFRDIRVRGGTAEIRLPWSPPDSARTAGDTARALAAERARPGRIILETPDGLRRVVTLAKLHANLPLLRVSAPDHSPLTFEVDSLRTLVSDPAVTVLDLAAHAWTRGDSLALTLHRAAMPNSRLNGGGVITWPNGPVRYDLVLDAARLDLADLRWISPDFPSLRGSGLITLRSPSDRLGVYRLDGLELGGAPGALRGGVTVLVDATRGIGVENMDLVLDRLDLDVPRPYLDTLDLHGTLDGRLSGRGFRDGLDLDADLRFRDADVPGAETWIRGRGRFVLGGPEGPVFDSVLVTESDIDLGTVRYQAPAVQLQGRLAMQGMLQGSWHDLTFEGTLRHQDGARPESRGEGVVGLDTRGEAAYFDVRLGVAPLAFDGLRGGYPGLLPDGAVTGSINAHGSADSLHFVTAVRGEPGIIDARGLLVRSAGRVRLQGVTARFSDLDLGHLGRPGTPTALNGHLRVTGVYDSLVGPDGEVEMTLEPGRVAELPVDAMLLQASADSGRLAVETLALRWPAGRLDGSGSLEWRTEGTGGLRFEFAAESLGVFEPMLIRLLALAPDTGLAASPLRGSAHGEVELRGSATAPRLLAWGRGQNLGWRGVRAPALAASLGLSSGERPELGASVQADSLAVLGWRLRDLGVVMGGFRDSLRWSGSARLGGARLGEDDGAGSGGGTLAGAGDSWTTAGDRRVSFDSLSLGLARHDWNLRQAAILTLASGAATVTPARLEATDGSGVITLGGTWPGSGEGAFSLGAWGLDLRDLYALLGRDTADVRGTVQADFAIGGTASRPVIQGTGSVADLAFGDVGSPFVQGVVHYADRKLETTLRLWRTGLPLFRIEAALPLDLAFGAVAQRQVEGSLMVRAQADSTDLVIAEAFSPNLRRVRGTLRADARISGTWEAPRLDGTVELRDAAATVPGLGLRYTAVRGAARLAGDSILLDSLTARSGDGTLRVTGGLRLDRLTRPVLGLTLSASRFRLIDVHRFLTLDASGEVRLTGPVFNARLTGRATADAGSLHFADLVTKRIVDLENPGDSGLIDLDLVRAERLGADFESRFLDSLAIEALRIQMGESFWLRSNEANIQLDGDLTVAKSRDRYRYDGTLQAIRGSYALRIGGLVTREFTVEQGSVRYFGTPDLNADLDILARHTVMAVETSDEVPVLARITGTLLQPRLELSSPPTTSRPALSQTELVSYLMFGRPTFSLQNQAGGAGGQVAAVEAGLSYLSSALSSELQRALITDLGVPIDYIDIRTGAGTPGLGGGTGGTAQVAQVAAGWQVGRRWFVTVVADLCTNTQRFYPKTEFRMTRSLRVKTSVEPAHSCQVALNQPTLSVNKYQVGLDFLWEREY